MPSIFNFKQEWQHQLRSSLHPALFAAFYTSSNKLMEAVSCFPQFRAMILAVLPNIVQAYFAAMGDYYTWKLSEKIYGRDSNASWASVMLLSIYTLRATNIHLALLNYMQSLAMVLLDANVLKLSRDNLNYHCVEFLALGDINGYCSRYRLSETESVRKRFYF